MRTLKTLGGFIVLLTTSVTWGATPTTWTTTFDPTIYGSSGTITFNDWGYKGPTGVGANNFQVGTGFDASRIGQRQEVVTLAPDGLTRDPAKTTSHDFSTDNYFLGGNMDGQVNFYQWAYTTPTSYFHNMQIDKAGNYFVAKSDMQFGYYDYFDFKHKNPNATYPPNEVYDTKINFYPWALSDAKGWCGSVLNSNPNGVGVMAGQVMFDVAFDVDVGDGAQHSTPWNSQVIPKFVMRSYGSYSVNVTATSGYLQSFSGSAVMNNNNPTINPLDANGEVTGNALDAAYHNRVSFLGAGVIPKGAWVFNDGTWNMTVADDQSTPGTTKGQARADGATWHINDFGGFAFLMRADGQRTLTYIGGVAGSIGAGHSDYVATDAAAYASLAAPVPVPSAVWLLGSGLLGLMGKARCKRN